MKLKLFLVLAALSAGLALASCETMSAEECAAADWTALGFNDAANNGADNLTNRAESCGERGIPADGAAYARGFSQGMYQFCQPPQGFQFARRGATFTGSCPAELQGNFYAAYSDGRRVYEAENELSTTRSRIDSLRSQINDLEARIDRRQEALSNATTDEERRNYRNDIDNFRRERRDKQDEMRDADARIYYLQRRVDDLRYEIGNRWAPW